MKQAKSIDPTHLLAATFENATEAILLLRTAPDQEVPTIIFANPEAERMTGYTAEELMGKPAAMLGGRATKTAAFLEYLAAIREGRIARARVLQYRKDGSTYWADLSSQRVEVDESGASIYINTRRDVDAEMRLKFLVDTSADVISRHGMDGKFIYISQTCENMFGFAPDELLGHNPFEYLHPDDVSKVLPISEMPEHYELQYRFRCKDGTYKWVESRARVVRGEGERSDVHEIHVFTRDVTERVRAEEQLRDTMHRYRELFEANPSPMWIYDPMTLAILEVNAMACKYYGYSREQFRSMTLRDLRPSEDIPLLEARKAAERRGLQDAGVWRHLKADGSLIEVHVITSDIQWEGKAARLGLLRDVTAAMKSERDLTAYRDRLQRSEQGLAAAQSVAHIGSWDYDIVSKRVAWTDELYQIYGLRREEFPPDPGSLWQFDHPDEVDDVRRQYDEASDSGQPYNVVHRLIRRDGSVRWVHEIGRFEYGIDGKPIREVGTIQDITERKLAEDRLAFLAHFDPLTGLPNRVLLEDRLVQNMARASREASLVAVLLLDLDNFKTVNDTLGRSYGDLLLQHVSEALRAEVRESDTVCRYSGDEFIILVNDLKSLDEVARVASRVATGIATLRSVEGRELHMSASIGICIFPNDGQDTDALIKHADVAMYQAKSEGGNAYRFYQPDMQKAVNKRLSVETDLRHAIEQDQLRLYYQPIVDLASGRIIAAEALLRWQHPDRGILAPGEFVSVAEETGMIVPIGRWVLNKAASDAEGWRRQGIDIAVNVNVSPRQFREPDLDQQVATAIEASGIAPERLHLEITESLLMDQHKALEITAKLKQIGVKIELDDFGTGYSSLGRLTAFPIDGLKVDQSFVAGLGRDDHSGVVTHAIIDLGRSLGMSVIAEGIETKEQLQILRNSGCLIGQGYLFSKPIPEPDFRALFLREDRRAG